MSDLPLVERPTCGCGHHDEDLPVLDARVIPHALRHAAILGALASLAPGRAMALVAPHDLITACPIFGQAVLHCCLSDQCFAKVAQDGLFQLKHFEFKVVFMKTHG